MEESQQNQEFAGEADGLSADEQMLVCYLDGELDSDSTAEIESRLAHDSGLRSRLHELQQAWDLLDELPPSSVNERFVQSTIEMMVTSDQSKRRKWHRGPLKLLALVAAFFISGLVIYNQVRQIQNRPYQEFIQDIEFIANVDFYDEIKTIEFLEQLKEQNLFEEELPRAP